MPVTEVPAATTVDSATTTTVAAPKEFNGWDEQGTPIRVEREAPKKADSATAAEEKDKTKPDSSTGEKKDKKTADTASDSATDTEQKRKQRTSEDTERRINELLDELKTVRRERDDLKSGKTSDTRESKPASQPAAEAKIPPLKQFLKEYFAKPDNKGKEYEDGVDAWQTLRDAEASKQLEQRIRQQIAAEAVQRDVANRVTEAKKLYPDFDQRIGPAVNAIKDDAQIPFAVKTVIDQSPVFEHLLYVLGEPATLKDIIATAKSNPGAALRKILLTEQLVVAELAKAKGKGKTGEEAKGDEGKGEDGKEKTGERGRDESGKFTSDKKDDAASETKPRAPKPPSEVGGRGTASEDGLRTAAAANDFGAFEKEQNRRVAARFNKAG
jgi:hypothetical protein